MNQRIGAQLFTLRDFTKTNEDFEETLKKISAMGMKDYQYSGVTAPHTPEEVKTLNEKYGLNLACSHISEARLLSEPEKVAEESIRMGCPTVGLSIYTKTKLTTLEDVKVYLKEMQHIGKVMHNYGLKFGIHNHTWEFHRYDGKNVLELLRDNTDPDEVEFIFCPFWSMTGGADPVEILYSFKGRINTMHYKDMTVIGGERAFCEVGKGNMNYKKIWEAAEKTGVKYAFIEQDICPRDPFECIKTSADYMKTLAKEYDERNS